MAAVVNRSISKLAKRIYNLNTKSVFIRSIATSDKKKDGAAAVSEPFAKDIPDFSKPLENKNWVTYGFDRNSEKDDLNEMHNFFFVSLTLCIMCGGFFFTYFPDFKDKDWANREAFLEIRRRESLGLPMVDKNYVDPAKILLPSDEELGDREIII